MAINLFDCIVFTDQLTSLKTFSVGPSKTEFMDDSETEHVTLLLRQFARPASIFQNITSQGVRLVHPSSFLEGYAFVNGDDVRACGFIVPGLLPEDNAHVMSYLNRQQVECLTRHNYGMYNGRIITLHSIPIFAPVSRWAMFAPFLAAATGAAASTPIPPHHSSPIAPSPTSYHSYYPNGLSSTSVEDPFAKIQKHLRDNDPSWSFQKMSTDLSKVFENPSDTTALNLQRFENFQKRVKTITQDVGTMVENPNINNVPKIAELHGNLQHMWKTLSDEWGRFTSTGEYDRLWTDNKYANAKLFDESVKKLLDAEEKLMDKYHTIINTESKKHLNHHKESKELTKDLTEYKTLWKLLSSSRLDLEKCKEEYETSISKYEKLHEENARLPSKDAKSLKQIAELLRAAEENMDSKGKEFREKSEAVFKASEQAYQAGAVVLLLLGVGGLALIGHRKLGESASRIKTQQKVMQNHEENARQLEENIRQLEEKAQHVELTNKKQINDLKEKYKSELKQKELTHESSMNALRAANNSQSQEVQQKIRRMESAYQKQKQENNEEHENKLRQLQSVSKRNLDDLKATIKSIRKKSELRVQEILAQKAAEQKEMEMAQKKREDALNASNASERKQKERISMSEINKLKATIHELGKGGHGGVHSQLPSPTAESSDSDKSSSSSSSPAKGKGKGPKGKGPPLPIGGKGGLDSSDSDTSSTPLPTAEATSSDPDTPSTPASPPVKPSSTSKIKNRRSENLLLQLKTAIMKVAQLQEKHTKNPGNDDEKAEIDNLLAQIQQFKFWIRKIILHVNIPIWQLLYARACLYPKNSDKLFNGMSDIIKKLCEGELHLLGERYSKNRKDFYQSQGFKFAPETCRINIATYPILNENVLSNLKKYLNHGLVAGITEIVETFAEKSKLKPTQVLEYAGSVQSICKDAQLNLLSILNMAKTHFELQLKTLFQQHFIWDDISNDTKDHEIQDDKLLETQPADKLMCFKQVSESMRHLIGHEISKPTIDHILTKGRPLLFINLAGAGERGIALWLQITKDSLELASKVQTKEIVKEQKKDTKKQESFCVLFGKSPKCDDLPSGSGVGDFKPYLTVTLQKTTPLKCMMSLLSYIDYCWWHTIPGEFEPKPHGLSQSWCQELKTHVEDQTCKSIAEIIIHAKRNLDFGSTSVLNETAAVLGGEYWKNLLSYVIKHYEHDTRKINDDFMIAPSLYKHTEMDLIKDRISLGLHAANIFNSMFEQIISQTVQPRQEIDPKLISKAYSEIVDCLFLLLALVGFLRPKCGLPKEKTRNHLLRSHSPPNHDVDRRERLKQTDSSNKKQRPGSVHKNHKILPRPDDKTPESVS